MVEVEFLNDVCNVLTKYAESHVCWSTVFQRIDSPNEEARGFLRFIADCLNDNELPIKHDESPEFVVLSKEHFNYKEECAYLCVHANNTYLRAVINELLWNLEHKRDQAEKAITAYAHILQMCETDRVRFCSVACAICRIYSKCNKLTFDTNSFWNLCFKFVETNIIEHDFLALFVILGLIDCKIRPKETDEMLITSIETLRNNGDYSKAIFYRNELISVYKAAKQPYRQLHIENARDYEQQASVLNADNPSDVFRIIHLIDQAMECWKNAQDKETKTNRERLALFLKPIKESLSKHMPVIQLPPIDITKIAISIEKQVADSSFEEVLLRIAKSITLKGYDYFSKMKEEGLASLFPSCIINSKGRVVANIPSKLSGDQEEQKKIAHSNAFQYYSNVAKLCVSCYLYYSKKKFKFSEENLRFLVEHNAFVPNDRRDTFLKGIVAGFSEDWSTSMHLLMPQVENAIRCLAELCDIIVYKTEMKPNGVEEVLSLSKILSLSELREYLEDDMIFNMEVFYSSQYGFGMRDQVSHGLLSDAELDSYNSMAVWCFTLYLCCIYCPELFKRIKQKESNNEQS